MCHLLKPQKKKIILMHDRQLFLFNQQFIRHHKMGKVNKRKISRGGKFNSQLNSVVANALQPMQTTGVISVLSNQQPTNGIAMNNTNLNNSIVSNTALTSSNHPQTNGSQTNLLNQNTVNQNLMSLHSSQTNLNTATVNQTATNQLIQTINRPQQTIQSQQQNSTSVHSLNRQLSQSNSQIVSNHSLIDLQQMNVMNNNSNCPPDLTMINNPFLSSNSSNSQCRLNNNNSLTNDLNSIQPQHNSKCARLETNNDLNNWTDLKPNIIKLENDLNSNSSNSNSSNNHSHNSSSSIESPMNCLLKNDLNIKLTGGYSSKSRNGKYELKILKQPEEQHR